MEKQKKKRGENWSGEDKEILRTIISQYANVLEDKSTKTNVTLLKNKTWKEVTNKLNEITAKSRSEVEVKLAWKRMKLAAKANLSLHKSEQRRTGGGQKPPSPSPEDLEVMAIAPLDFVEDTNNYDSDAVTWVRSETLDSPKVGASSAKDVPEFDYSPKAGPSSAEDIPVSIDTPKADSNSAEDVPVIIVVADKNPEQVTPENNLQKNEEKKKKMTAQNKSEQGRREIVNSNLNFKKKQLQMLEIEHTYNIKISELQIKKLELEIALLKNTNSD